MGRSHRRAAKAAANDATSKLELGDDAAAVNPVKASISQTKPSSSRRTETVEDACTPALPVTDGAHVSESLYATNREGNRHESERVVRRILHRYGKGLEVGEKRQLSEEDSQLMWRVFIRHPNHQEKQGPGVESFWTKRTEFGTCFMIQRVDGSTVDFAWRKCFRHDQLGAPHESGHSPDTAMGCVDLSGGQELLRLLKQSAGNGANASNDAAHQILGMLRDRTFSTPSSGPEPQPLSTDEFLLTAVESREDRELGADQHNWETFGEDAAPGGGAWDYDAMMQANRSLTSIGLATDLSKGLITPFVPIVAGPQIVFQ